ncbi:MAG: insulinase family protein [Spirochaetales bacterium]|nr:insulinase family protein [Spirochaetales bacterium]
MDFEKGQIIHNFEVLSFEDNLKLKAKTLHLQHQVTGLQVFHMITDDPENLFAYAFSTPPYDNTGLPHILEHCCLAGSKNYPLKDPFQVMMQKSVNTFLNAMTYSDRTIYPAASVLEKDYFNLFEMYGDAVFSPLLRKETFYQEGWRLALNAKKIPEIKGIVFNEMKGAYSDIEGILYEHSSRDLFVESPYCYDSGGDPLYIPDLSYEKFCDFHKKYYSPSNCRLFLYGNISTEKQLRLLNEKILKDYHHKTDLICVGESVKVPVPVSSRYTGPAVKDDNSNVVSINWGLKNTLDSYLATKLALMSYVLLGNPGSILYKAILDSDLCEDISDVSGIDTYLKEYIFSCGIRGCKEGDEKKFEKFIIETLEQVVRDGIPRVNIDAALNKFEFSSFEIKSGSPVGLSFMNKVMKSWIYGGSPEAGLDYIDHFEDIRKELVENPRLFEDIIQEQLLDNPVRSLIVVSPDSKFEKKLERELKKKAKSLAKIIDMDQLQQETEAFNRYAKLEDTQEELTCIPAIRKEDIPQTVRELEFSTIENVETKTFYSDIFTNSIFYIASSFDFTDIPSDLLPYVSLFSRAVFDLSLENKSYDQVSNEIAIKLGGLYAALDIATQIGKFEEPPVKKFIISMKATNSLLSEGLDLLEEIVTTVNFRDFKRMKEILIEVKNDFEMNAVSAATSLSMSRVASAFSQAYVIDDQLNGYPQYGFISRLLKNFEEEKEGLAAKMYQLMSFIFAGQRVYSFSGEKKLLDLAQSRFDRIFSRFSKDHGLEASQIELNSFKNEGVVIPANVSFSAVALKGAYIGTKEFCAYKILSTMMKTGVLWDIVRNRNGAYGVSSGINGSEGVFLFSSYRDPETVKTLAAYKEALEYFAAQKFDKESFDSAVVSVLGKELRPLRPSEHNLTVLRRYNYGITEQLRQLDFDFIKSLEPSDIANAAKTLLASFSDSVASFSAPERLLKLFGEKEIVIRKLSSF